LNWNVASTRSFSSVTCSNLAFAASKADSAASDLISSAPSASFTKIVIWLSFT